MRLFICISLIVFCFTTSNIAQKVKKPTVVKPVVVSQFAEAEKAWIPFWRDFKRALGDRDKNAFQETISKEYTGTGNCRDANFSDKRLGYFCNNQLKWWEGLIWIFSKGIKVKKIQRVYSEIERRVTTDESKEVGDIAIFRFENDGNWYFRSKLFWGT